MHGITSTRICAGILLLGTASCRVPEVPVPVASEETPDLTGQVVEARIVRTLGGTKFTFGRLGGTSDAEYIQRLQVRVNASRNTTPVAEAIVGVDGITTLARADSAHAEGHLEMPGAYVRIWFRGAPNRETPGRLSGMARRVIVDSVASVGASR